MTLDLGELLKLALQQSPLIFVLVGIVIAGHKRLWVYGWQFDQAVKEREEYRRIALQAVPALEQCGRFFARCNLVSARVKATNPQPGERVFPELVDGDAPWKT